VLSVHEIARIEQKAAEQRKICNLGEESPVGSKFLFYLFEHVYNSYILLYPLATKKVAGFTRKQGELIQVFINTSFNLSFQTFAAAHELFHLISLREKPEDELIICNDQDVSEEMDNSGSNIDEIQANYFAAAFLLPQNVVRKRFESIKGKSLQKEDLVLQIIGLENEYDVPYKTVLKRLKELRLIDSGEFDQLTHYEEQIFDYCKMLDSEIQKRIQELEKPSARKYHTLNVPKLAFDTYKFNRITINKLESIIKKYDKNLSDFGVTKPVTKPLNIDFSNFGTGDDKHDED
jgi:Zn-dependent peptidase ImmA (M78 family)